MNKKHGTGKSYYHRGGDEPLSGLTIPAQFSRIASRFPEHEAIASLPQDLHITYRELSNKIDQLAQGLVGAGFGKSDRIGIWSTNNIEWLLLQMATARIGVILVNINPAYRPGELGYALKRSEVEGLFIIPSFKSSDYISMLVELIPELKDAKSGNIQCKEFPYLRRVVIYEPSIIEHTLRPYSGFTTWQDIIDSGKTVTKEQLDDITDSLDCDDAINIQYTSGTTGFPKAVVLSHHNILNNALFTAQAMHFTEKDRLCISVPFYHCFGMVLANLLCFSTGACAVIPAEYFEPGAILKAVDKEHCTAIHGVPTMFIAELEHRDFNKYDLSSLRTGIMAGAPCPPSLMQRVIEDMHCPEILIGYGETEASPLTHLTTREDNMERRVETVGKNLPHQEVKIIDIESRKTVPFGESGEICFRGYHIMKGYYRDEEATRKSIDDNGWLHSGDIGTMDKDGYVKITGRLKDLIIRGGENIYPREIEDYLFTHPKIAEVAVFGIPDEFYGEQVMAWIQLHADESMTENDVRRFCKGKLSHFKIPKHIRFVDDFPMTVTGKLQKYRMREIALEQLQTT